MTRARWGTGVERHLAKASLPDCTAASNSSAVHSGRRDTTSWGQAERKGAGAALRGRQRPEMGARCLFCFGLWLYQHPMLPLMPAEQTLPFIATMKAAATASQPARHTSGWHHRLAPHLSCRVAHIHPLLGLALHKLAVDEQLDGGLHCGSRSSKVGRVGCNEADRRQTAGGAAAVHRCW